MNKFLLAVVFCTVVSLSAGAQSKFSLGPTAGVGWTTLSNIPNSKFKAAGNFGLAAVYSAVEHFGIGLDVKYSIEGAKSNIAGGEQEYDLHYLRLPLKAIYFFGDHGNRVRPKLYAGPTFGFLSSAKINQPNGTEVNIKSTTESFDFGVNAGGGLNYRLVNRTWLNVDLAYYHGIKEINSTADLSNRNVQLNVGVNFGL